MVGYNIENRIFAFVVRVRPDTPRMMLRIHPPQLLHERYQRLHIAAVCGDVVPDDEAVCRRHVDVVSRLQLSVAHVIFLHVHERRVVIRIAAAVPIPADKTPLRL